MENFMVPSFFFTNSTRAPHGETLGVINPFCSNSSNWVFYPLSSVDVILYGAFEISCVPGINSISKAISL